MSSNWDFISLRPGHKSDLWTLKILIPLIPFLLPCFCWIMILSFRYITPNKRHLKVGILCDIHLSVEYLCLWDFFYMSWEYSRFCLIQENQFFAFGKRRSKRLWIPRVKKNRAFNLSFLQFMLSLSLFFLLTGPKAGGIRDKISGLTLEQTYNIWQIKWPSRLS